MTTQSILLKTDARLRVQTPKAQREALLDLFLSSTATAKAFAAEHGIKYPTFAVWVQNRRKRSVLNGSAVPGAMGGKGCFPTHSPNDQPQPQPQPQQWLEALISPGLGFGTVPLAGGISGGILLDLPGGARLRLADLGQVELVGALLLALERGALSGRVLADAAC
jgi:hypothetical protein